MMNKYKFQIAILTLMIGFLSCENQDFEYEDFDYQSVYFPYQYPVRTISLGNDAIDNSLDKQHKFNIGINIGGLYGENSNDWIVDFVKDESLVPDYLVNGNGDTLKVLPDNYYTMEPSNSVVIPKGSFAGLISVQLNDNFFADTMALTGQYVIPLKITQTDADTILSGKPADGIEDPNRHVTTDWEGGIFYPRDYTLFGVKYVNPYHGKWLRRSTMYVRNIPDGIIVDTITIRNQYVERDQVVGLNSISLTSVVSDYLGHFGNNRFYLSVDEETKTISLSTSGDSQITASGIGKFVEHSDEMEQWGGKFRDAIYLEYEYETAENNHYEVFDTLVFRDRQIKMEDARPEFVQP